MESSNIELRPSARKSHCVEGLIGCGHRCSKPIVDLRQSFPLPVRYWSVSPVSQRSDFSENSRLGFDLKGGRGRGKGKGPDLGRQVLGFPRHASPPLHPTVAFCLQEKSLEILFILIYLLFGRNFLSQFRSHIMEKRKLKMPSYATPRFYWKTSLPPNIHP